MAYSVRNHKRDTARRIGLRGKPGHRASEHGAWALPSDPAISAVLRRMPLAAIVCPTPHDTHPVLAAFLQSLRAEGWRVGQLLPHRAQRDDAHLVVAHHFGAQETQGQGLAPAMLALMGALIPVVAIVASAELPAWRRFTGGAGAILPMTHEALTNWFHAVAQPQQPRQTPMLREGLRR